jgi:hypothetical protein
LSFIDMSKSLTICAPKAVANYSGVECLGTGQAERREASEAPLRMLSSLQSLRTPADEKPKKLETYRSLARITVLYRLADDALVV